MTIAPEAIRPIYDMPGHPHYGAVRRMWVMSEQLFADRGGIAALERAIADNAGPRGRPTWYDHYARLRDSGQTECAASRIVMQQLLFAAEYLL